MLNMNWFFYALGAAGLMAAYQVSARAFLRVSNDSSAFTFITVVLGGLTALPFLLFEEFRLSLSLPRLILLLTVGLIFAAIDLVFSRARQLEEVSRMAIAIQTGFFWNLLFGWLFFSEVLKAQKLAGVLLIGLGNLIVIWRGQRLRLTTGFSLAVLGVFLFNISSGLSKDLINDFSPVFYIAATSLLEGLIIYLFLGLKAKERIVREFESHQAMVLLVGPLLAYATILLNKAFESGGEFSKVLPIFSLALVFSTLGGIFFLGEKEHLYRKVGAMLLAFAGAYLIQSV